MTQAAGRHDRVTTRFLHIITYTHLPSTEKTAFDTLTL